MTNRTPSPQVITSALRKDDAARLAELLPAISPGTSAADVLTRVATAEFDAVECFKLLRRERPEIFLDDTKQLGLYSRLRSQWTGAASDGERCTAYLFDLGLSPWLIQEGNRRESEPAGQFKRPAIWRSMRFYPECWASYSNPDIGACPTHVRSDSLLDVAFRPEGASITEDCFPTQRGRINGYRTLNDSNQTASLVDSILVHLWPKPAPFRQPSPEWDEEVVDRLLERACELGGFATCRLEKLREHPRFGKYHARLLANLTPDAFSWQSSDQPAFYNQLPGATLERLIQESPSPARAAAMAIRHLDPKKADNVHRFAMSQGYSVDAYYVMSAFNHPEILSDSLDQWLSRDPDPVTRGALAYAFFCQLTTTIEKTCNPESARQLASRLDCNVSVDGAPLVFHLVDVNSAVLAALFESGVDLSRSNRSGTNLAIKVANSANDAEEIRAVCEHLDRISTSPETVTSMRHAIENNNSLHSEGDIALGWLHEVERQLAADSVSTSIKPRPRTRRQTI